MKKLRIAAIITALIMAIACLGSVTAFASEVAVAPSGSDALASGSDVSGSDVLEHLYDYTLSDFYIDYHRMSFSAPRLESSFSASYSNSEIAESFGSYNLSDILDYSDYYGGTYSYLYYGASANQDVLMNIMYAESNYARFIGDYSSLSKAELEDIRSGISLLANDEYPEVRRIGGNIFLVQQYADPETGSVTIVAQTVVKGGLYTVYIELADPSQLDLVKADLILDSVRIGGVRVSHTGAASSTLVTVLLILVILLAIIAALLLFFLIRFNAFSKAAGSRFSIIGFNMPPKSTKSNDGE